MAQAEEREKPADDDAARFIVAMRTIMSLPTKTIADIQSRRVTPPNAIARLRKNTERKA